MARACASAAAALLLLTVPGCGREEGGGSPTGCRAGVEAIRDALRSAPGEVRVEGTPLSACLGDTSDGGDLMEVGTAFVQVATRLADEASERPEGDAALKLGYLLGAAERGEHGAQGVGYELGRRLRSEAERVGDSAAFRRGRRAGRGGG